MSINVNSFQYNPVDFQGGMSSVDSVGAAALLELEANIGEQKSIVQSSQAELHSLNVSIAEDTVMLKTLQRENASGINSSEDSARNAQMISELDAGIASKTAQKEKAAASMLEAGDRMVEGETKLKSMAGLNSADTMATSSAAAKASASGAASGSGTIFDIDMSNLDKVLETYGLGMALSMLQMQSAQEANQYARMFLEEVKLVQDRAQTITQALEYARKIKASIDSSEKVDNSTVDKLNGSLKKINVQLPLDTILVDGKKPTEEMKKKLGEYIVPDIIKYDHKTGKDDDDINKAKISAIISSLSEWQDTYTSRVGTIMVDVNDSSSRYSSFMSGANQGMDKVVNLLKKMVNTL